MANDKRIARFVISLDEQGARIDEFARRANESMGRAGKGATGFQRVLQTGVGTALGFLTAKALPAMGRALTDALDRTSQVAALQNGFENLTAAQGLNADVMISKLRPAMRNLISDYDLMQQTNNALTLGIVQSEDQWANLSGAALKLGRAVGLDANRALESLSIGLGRQSKLVLDNLGVIVDAEGAYESYAEKLGKTASELTDAEKKQAFLDEATKKIIETADRAGEAQLTLGDRIDQAKTRMVNFGDALIRTINDSPAFQIAMDGIAQAIGGMDGILDTIVAKFQEHLPTAIIITLRAMDGLHKVAGIFEAAWASAITGIAHLWDLAIAGMAKGTALVLDGVRELFSRLRDKEAETFQERVYNDAAEETLQQYSNMLNDNVASALQNVRTRTDEWNDRMQAISDRTNSFTGFIDDLVEKVRNAGEASRQAAAAMGGGGGAGGGDGLASVIEDLKNRTLELDTSQRQYSEAVEKDLTPNVGAAAESAQEATIQFSDFTSAIRTGNQWIDQAIGMIFKLTDSLIGGGGLSFGFGKAGDSATSFFGKISGALGGLGGGLLGGGIGLAIGGIAALIGKIGGPSQAELDARSIYAGINAEIGKVLDSTQKATAAGRDWATTNLAVEKIYLATGRSAEEAAAMATRLVNSVRMTPQEAQAVADEMAAIYAEYQSTIEKAANDASAAQEKTADEAARVTEKAAEAITANYHAAYKKIEQDASLSADEQAKAIKELTDKYAIAMKNIEDESKRATDTAKKNIVDPLKAAAGEIQRTFDGLDLSRGLGRGLDFTVGRATEVDTAGIPHLANGGIVTRPTLAMLGEGGRPEAVLPLSGSGAALRLHVTGGDDSRTARFIRDMIRHGDVRITSGRRSETFD